jgi:cytochrome b6-f complex iron-sulfur subunit
MLTQESISRKEFLRNMGLGGAALMAVLASCQNSDGSILPSGGIQVDLSAKLLTVNSYIYSNGVIIARTAAGNAPSSFAAVAQTCTHEGTTILYQNNGKFHCPNHGAEYNTSGVVTLGPATKALKKYTVAVSGTMLTIS